MTGNLVNANEPANLRMGQKRLFVNLCGGSSRYAGQRQSNSIDQDFACRANAVPVAGMSFSWFLGFELDRRGISPYASEPLRDWQVRSWQVRSFPALTNRYARNLSSLKFVAVGPNRLPNGKKRSLFSGERNRSFQGNE